MKPPQPWPRRSFTLTVVLALLTLGWLSVTAFRGYRFLAVQLPEIERMEELRGQILLLDEILTMSARMASATGDLQWEARYRQSEPQLDEALKEAMRLAPALVGSHAAVQTDAANTKLELIEKHAFELVRQGQRAAAHQLVNSTDYEAARSSYAKGMAEISILLKQSIKSLQRKQQVELLGSVSISAVAAAMLVLSWWLVLRAMRRWKTTLLDNQQNMNRQTAELRESEERFRALFENAPVGVFYSTVAGKIIRVNAEYARMLGYASPDEVKEIVNRSTIAEANYVQSDERSELMEKAVAIPGKWLRTEKQFRKKDGTHMTANLVIRALPDHPDHLEGFLEDITERKRAEAMLRRSEEKFAKAFQASPTIIVLSRISDGRLIEANEAFEKVIGYTREEALGHTTIELNLWANPADRERLMQILHANRRLQGEEVQFRAKRGEVIIGLLFAELIELDREDHLLAVVEDITERKQLELQFLQAQKMQAVGHLAGGVAHDFNNILAALTMGLELLRAKPNLEREAQVMLKDLASETKRAASLTRQLLMFSRRSVLEVRVLDLNEVVANLLKMLGRLLGEHLTLVFERHSTLPPVEADAGMLEQVLMNLVVNARDAMPRGGRITIATEAVEFGPEQLAANPSRCAGRCVCLAVADTGIGMNAATLKRIFEPFFTTKETGKGTGLGLATVHGIVTQHGGWVEVESKVNLGTTFRVYLPATAKVEAPEPEESKPPALPRGQETLLVVEDDAGVRQMLVQTLRVLGYRVFPASNGQEAMNLWRNHGRQVDLLLTDMVMPEGMTGLELAERVRAEKPNLKIIISSGYSTELVRWGNTTAEGIVYLPKPYELSHLGTILRRCLNSERNLP